MIVCTSLSVRVVEFLSLSVRSGGAHPCHGYDQAAGKGNSHLILLCYSCNSPCFEIVLCFCGGLVYPSFQSESMASAPSLNTNQSLQDNVEVIEEMVSLVENVSVDDFSLDLVPNDEVAKETISRSLVGKFFAKRKVGNGKLRSILSQMWNVSPGWSMQEIHPKIFIFRFSKESDALKVLEKGPWSPCGGFLLLTTMPSDGKWSFADLEHVNIWVRALGVPYRFFSDDNVIKIANRVGSFVLADKVRSNGVIRSNFLRFRVSLDLAKPLLAGVGLDDEDGKKVWSYFKCEWLPLVCYKCGVIGHEEDACSARKRMMVLDDGRSVPLFGPWLKVGSRLENGLAVLKAEDIQERIQMEQEDAPCDTNPKAASKSSVSVEGRVIHGGDNSFSIQGEEGTAKTTPNHISGDPLGARPFNVLESTLGFNNGYDPIHKKGGGKRKGPIGSNPTHRNSKVAKLTGPKGVAKKPIFGYNSVSAVEQVGNKRKKSQPQKECNLFQGDNSNLPHEPGTKDGILDVFAEISVAADATRAYPRDNLNGEEESLKFCEVSRPRKQKKSMGKSDSLLALEQDDGLFEVSVGISNDSKLLTNSALPTGEFMVELSGSTSLISDANIAKGRVTHNTVVRNEDFQLAEEAGLIMPPKENPDVLFLMETKVHNSKMGSIWRRLGFSDAVIVDPVGSAGGLCLCWRAGIDIEVVSFQQLTISVKFSNTLNCACWMGLFVYGPPIRSERRAFWEDLALVTSSLSGSWALLGDLNSILNDQEKFGGMACSPREVSDLSNFLLISGGVDLGSVGNFFTWTNNRKFDNLVKERLDRVIGSADWIMAFPKAGVNVLSIRESDHAPVVLDLMLDRDTYRRPFRYLEAWNRDPSCREVVREAWSTTVRGCQSFQLMAKLSCTRRLLAKWNREYFGMCQSKLRALERLLIEVQSRNPSPENASLEADILLEIDEIETHQCVIWRQKSPNTADLLKQDVLDLLGFRFLRAEDFFLGNPLLVSKSKRRDFNFVVERIKSRLEGWRSKLLSQAGRTTLINSVLSSIPIYTMSCFLLPKSVCELLDKLVRKFWWVGCSDKQRYLSLLNWDEICKPKACGGLGIKKFHDMNLALVSKLGWALAKGDRTPWCRLFLAKYCRRDSNFWNASIPSSASWGAKGIFATRDLIRRESCCAVLYLDQFVNFDRSLNLGDLSIWFKPEFLEQLGRLSLLPPGSHDSLVWKSSLDGSFSVKSAYTAIIECRKGDLDVLFQQLWKTPFSERVKLFMWKVGKDILPCGQRLYALFGNTSCCVLCENAEDSLEHLFFHCHMARYCWFKSSWGIRSDLLSFASTREILNWILNPPFGGSVDLPQFSLFAASLCYTLWNVRNKTFHDNLLATPESIFQTVMKSLRETRDWVAPSGSLQQPIVVPGLDRLWSGSLVNIFVDAAMRGTDAFLAILSLDDQGRAIEAFSVKISAGSSLEGETLAIFHAISRCISCNWSRVRIYSDCKVAVDAVLARKIPNWKLSSLFLQLFNLLDGFVSCKLCWISRLLNVAAHSLATRAASLNFCGLFSVTDVSAAMNSN
uniref:CCHC-type domain-containing protein n=1 Tax=Cannabis sativa TaxID=3483 RepID=A0A803NSP5_CANSA